MAFPKALVAISSIGRPIFQPYPSAMASSRASMAQVFISTELHFEVPGRWNGSATLHLAEIASRDSLSTTAFTRDFRHSSITATTAPIFSPGAAETTTNSDPVLVVSALM